VNRHPESSADAPLTVRVPGAPSDGEQQALDKLRQEQAAVGDWSTGQVGSLPDVGDQVFGFLLCQPLGSGAFARVFLGEQTDLARRLVVLKISAAQGHEPQTLAQLQHTNIVPIYSVHDDASAGLRALCMPYFGGASLSDVLKRLRATTPRPTAGADLLRVLDAVSAPAPEVFRRRRRGLEAPAATDPADSQGPRAILGRLSYLQAAAWIVARLAEGLQHAHQRRILHRDIKPSNILLACDGQPLLLDFNLAHDAATSPARATLGGTIAYMSPEHLRALSLRNPALAPQVDARSDLYALGMVLYEMLAGHGPFEQSASYTRLPELVEAMAVERSQAQPSLRPEHSAIPWSLESIVRRCLASEPQKRYQSAQELAEDLQRFLEDRPLRYAPELSLLERGQKWMRRHPRLSSAAAVAVAAGTMLLAGGAVLASVQTRLADTSEQLAAAAAQQRWRTYEELTVQALFLVNTTAELQDHLRQGRAVCEDALSLYHVREREDWPEHADWQRLDAGQRARLAEDTRELLLLLAGARVRLAPGAPGELRAALTLLDRAERVPGLRPSRALWADRAAYHRALGEDDAAERAARHADATPADSARDHYLLAMTSARDGRFAQALDHLDEALRREPDDHWAWMQRGLCHQELGEHARAAGDFGVCIGLRPSFAWGYFNRGYALAQCGKREAALADYTLALQRDPGLAAARVNRGMQYLELKRYEPALADLQAARAAGRDDAALATGLGAALEGLGRHDEADQAFTAAAARAPEAPPRVRQRLRWAYGFAVAARLPERARAAFAEALQADPTDAFALYGCAMLHDRNGRGEEALQYYARALEAAPGFDEARRCRAVLLARQGHFQTARTEMNVCLAREPSAGATLYAAACIAALESAQADPLKAERLAREALAFLHQAFARGYGQGIAASDRDLEGLRSHRQFRQLLQTPGPAA
jgi:eukaryotic-like serine/threonine-protein kinase